MISQGSKGFSFVDLFAGIGGFRLAFESHGGSCVFSSEWDRFAQATYAANFGHSPHGDITQIKLQDIPDHDILLAGFPCQPFSQAGLKNGFSDTRGTLFFDIARILNAKNPPMVLLENVKGFESHNKGRTFQVVRRALEDLGYEVHAQVLNARDFGLPQNRERIFIVAIDRTQTSKEPFVFPTGSKAIVNVGQILEKSVSDKYTISDQLWKGHKRRLREHRAKGNGFGYRLFSHSSCYTSTISARYYKDGSEILIQQDGRNPRKITPREAARLQGFPDSFDIPVSDTQAYRQFGNSVAVPVVAAIAQNMIPLLKGVSRS